MIRKRFPWVIGAIFLISILPCNLISGPSETGGNTQAPAAAIQTPAPVLVDSTAEVQTAIANSVASTLAAMQTNTPEIPMAPANTFTPTFTLTPSAPIVSVSVQTNCRSGPGTAYDVLGIINVGDTAEVVGRSLYNDNWIIKLPSNPAMHCWLWGQYATLVGDTSGLPVITPPPSPTPAASFAVEYSSITFCPAAWYSVTFKITNTGSVTWESSHIDIVDSAQKYLGSNNDDEVFQSYTGCISNPPAQNLGPGEVAYSTSGIPPLSPYGQTFNATIRVCSQNGMAGVCLDKTLTFTP